MGGLGTFALGVSAALAARAFAPALGRWARPAVRGAIKQGIILSQGAQVRMSEMREDIEDLVAEARDDVRRDRTSRGQPEAAAGPDA